MESHHLAKTLREASSLYARLGADNGFLREDAPTDIDFSGEAELALQARFFAGEFGDAWTTECGRSVRLLDPGMWNREAGPDFRGACVLFDGEEKCTGDLEIDIDSVSWETHGHARNPDFENVLLHCFFREGTRRAFARTRTNRFVPQVRLGSRGGDAVHPRVPPEPAESLEGALGLIEVAARHRLARKARAIHLLAGLHGRRDALFQSLARALGYRNNSIPLVLLAQRSSAKEAASATGEALLFGLSGFLESREPPSEAGRRAAYLVELWKEWWKLRDSHQRLILPSTAWKLTGSRPANHPHRRVAALRLVAVKIDALSQALDSGEDRLFASQLRSLEHPFWGSHWNLSAGVLGGRQSLALLGENRVRDILVNVFAPAQAAMGADSFALWNRLLPGQIPSRVRDIADWLYPGFPVELLRSAAHQQGVLQLGADFFGRESPRALEQRYLAL